MKCLEQGKTATDAVKEMIADYLQGQEKSRKNAR